LTRTPLLLAAVMTSLAMPALAADPLLDRYKAAAIKTGTNMIAYFETCAPGISGKLPEIDYTPEMDAAASCQLSEYRKTAGDAAVEELVAEAEAWSELPFVGLESMNPVGVHGASDAFASISVSCNVVAASQTTNIGKAMRENMTMLMPCFSQ
jgi:hypothetical protein